MIDIFTILISSLLGIAIGAIGCVIYACGFKEMLSPEQSLAGRLKQCNAHIGELYQPLKFKNDAVVRRDVIYGIIGVYHISPYTIKSAVKRVLRLPEEIAHGLLDNNLHESEPWFLISLTNTAQMVDSRTSISTIEFLIVNDEHEYYPIACVLPGVVSNYQAMPTYFITSKEKLSERSIYNYHNVVEAINEWLNQQN